MHPHPGAHVDAEAVTAPPDLAAPHRLILVRHGQTEHTAAQRISGAGFRPEPALDEAGWAQARAAADRLARSGAQIDELVVSPLLRARQTAQAIVDRFDLPVTVQEGWSEAHFGAWEGLTVAEVSARHPGAWQTMIGDPGNAPPGGESLLDVRARVLSGWRAAGVSGRTTVVVTHLTPIRIVVAETLRTPHDAFPRVLASPGSITVIDRWADEGAAVIALGERPIIGSLGGIIAPVT